MLKTKPNSDVQEKRQHLFLRMPSLEHDALHHDQLCVKPKFPYTETQHRTKPNDFPHIPRPSNET